MNSNDASIVRELAREYAEIAALPVHGQKIGLWKKLNAKKPERPMVIIDQVCWNEMNVDNELTLRCTDPYARGWEGFFRRAKYKWKHFPVDMVFSDQLNITKVFTNSGFGVEVEQNTLATDSANDVVAHAYENQFHSMEDVEKIKIPAIRYDEAETRRRLEQARALFDGIIGVRLIGATPYVSVWDPLTQWMGVESALYAMMDEPDMMRAIVEKMVEGHMSALGQMEDQGLLEHSQPLIHCTGAWTDELPAPGFNPDRPRLRDMWVAGLAQVFSSVSPQMFDEFEIEPCLPLFERFGLVYYGCCDPLDGKMEQVRKIPHLRKISMSPWANKERGAAEIAGDYVFSCKPNPSYLGNAFSEDVVRRELAEAREICRREGCPLEFVLKDISTVGHEPQRLWKWAEIAMEIAQG
jgi:hypothetical protein